MCTFSFFYINTFFKFVKRLLPEQHQYILFCTYTFHIVSESKCPYEEVFLKMFTHALFLNIYIELRYALHRYIRTSSSMLT